MDKLEAFARAHWQALMVVLGVWIAIATALARKWPKPAATAAWYVKAAHFLLVDLPSLAATLNGKTWMGFTFSIPFITWTVREQGSTAGGASMLLPLLLLPALLAVGCGSAMTDTLKVEDTLAVTSSVVSHAVDGADALLEVKTRSQMTTDQAGAKAFFDSYKPKIEKARAAVRTASDTVADVEAVRSKIPSASGGTCASGCTGVASDLTSWYPALTQALAALQQTYADVKGLVH